MSGYIPKEQLDAYRRWQLESFDAPAEPAVDEVPQPAAPPEPRMDEAAAAELVAQMGLPTAEDIERIHNEAHESGYRAGFDEGREEGYRTGLEAAQEQALRIASLADNVETALAGIDQSVADQVLGLALEVAHQVLRGSVAARRDNLLPIVREALAALPLHHGHVSLHVNPEEAAMLREHLGDQFAHSGWRIVEDREISAGGCFVHAGSSEVDATLETRWKRVLEAIGADPGPWLETK